MCIAEEEGCLEFSGMWLPRSVWKHVDAAFATVDRTVLTESAFIGSDLSWLKGVETVLTGAVFVEGTSLRSASLPDVVLDGAKFDTTVDTTSVNWANGSLRQVILPHLHAVNLDGAKLQRSRSWERFHRATVFANTRIDRTEWNFSIFVDCNLAEARASALAPPTFGNACFYNTSFDRARLPFTQFPNAEFHGCSFRDTDLRGANFDAAAFLDCDLSGADTAGASFTKATDNGEPFPVTQRT